MTDDPAIPDELGALLRAGSKDLEVAPAELRTVEHRARQRRRRRHALVATSAAAVVLLAGLTIVQIGRTDPEHETIIATTPPAADPDAVPQPLLVRGAPDSEDRPEDDGPGPGGALLSITSAGATTWWTTSGEWFPVGAYELADGRRFGVATTNSTGLGVPPKARIDEIGTDGTSLSSKAIPLEVPWGSFSASIRPIGAIGDEVILQRNVSRVEPIDDVFSKLLTTTTYAAIDVDSGAERPLFGVDGTPGSGSDAVTAAVGDLVVRAVDGRCKLVVSTLEGRDARTLTDVCPRRVGGASGFVLQVAVSPDGRYAAVISSGIDAAASPADALEVIDLTDASSIVTKPAPSGSFRGMGWTGVHQLTVAFDPGQPSLEIEAGDVTVGSVGWDGTGG